MAESRFDSLVISLYLLIKVSSCKPLIYIIINVVKPIMLASPYIYIVFMQAYDRCIFNSGAFKAQMKYFIFLEFVLVIVSSSIAFVFLLFTRRNNLFLLPCIVSLSMDQDE